jgi:hypothetical protein
MLAEALANVPPALVIIGGEVPQEAIAAPGPEEEVGEEHDYQLAGGFAASGTADHAPAAAVTMGPRPMTRSVIRPRQRSSGGLFLLINYVVGGVLGLAMGLVVLWWGLARDPLELGPPVARYVPWIVPRAFRGSAAPATATNRSANSSDSAVVDFSRDDANSRPGRSTERRPRARKPAAATSNDPAGELQTLPALDAPAATAPAASPIDMPVLDSGPLPSQRESQRSAPPQPPEDLIRAPANSDSQEQAKSPESAAARPPMPDLTDLLAGWAPGPPAPAERAMPAVSARDFIRTVKAADEALQKYEQLSKEDQPGRQQALERVWQAASEAGQMLSYFEASDASLREAVDRLDTVLRSLGGERLKAINAITAAEWPKLMSGDGVLVAGKVQDISSAGQLYHLRLQPGGSDSSASELPPSVALLSSHDPHDLCSVGDEFLTIGRIVDEPRQNLPGYEGEQNRVVAVGFSVKVR